MNKLFSILKQRFAIKNIYNTFQRNFCTENISQDATKNKFSYTSRFGKYVIIFHTAIILDHKMNQNLHGLTDIKRKDF